MASSDFFHISQIYDKVRTWVCTLMWLHKGYCGYLFYYMVVSLMVILSWFVMMWSVDFKPFLVGLVTTWPRPSFSRIAIYDLLMEVSLSTFMLVSLDKKVEQSQEEKTLHRMLSSVSIRTYFSLFSGMVWYTNSTKRPRFLFLSFISSHKGSVVESMEKRYFGTLYSNDSLR